MIMIQTLAYIQALAYTFLFAIVLRGYPILTTNRQKRILLVALSFVATYLKIAWVSTPTSYLVSNSSSSSSSHITLNLPHPQTIYTQAKDATLVVFYNLFIPHTDDKAINNAINVTTDQISQVSAALSRLEVLRTTSKHSEHGVLFYNLIGNIDALSQSKMADLCHSYHPKLDCIQLQHYTNATEYVTLSNLHEYCHTQHVLDDPTKRVVYLHSKGSFHDHGKQTPWRRQLTNASLHPDCLYPPNETCDVCGAQYYTMFASMFPGNMWTAKCSYIRKLLPPVKGGEYERRKVKAIKQFFLLKEEGILHNTLGWHQDVFYGLDRYIWEHWVGSHPELQPCEIHATMIGFWDMVEGKKDVSEKHGHYDWGLGPRRELIFTKAGDKTDWKSNDEDANFKQFYYLAGNLIKWISLYDTVPKQDSWVWKHFLAGHKWKVHVAKYGTDSLRALVDMKYSVVDNHFSTTSIDNKDRMQSNSSAVIELYGISIPTTDDDNKETKKKALEEAVKAQFEKALDAARAHKE